MSKLTCFLGLHRWRISRWSYKSAVGDLQPSQEQCARCGLKRAYED